MNVLPPGEGAGLWRSESAAVFRGLDSRPHGAGVPVCGGAPLLHGEATGCAHTQHG